MSNELGLSQKAKARKARRKRFLYFLNDFSVYFAASLGSVVRKIMPDAVYGGETIRTLTPSSLITGIFVGCFAVFLREWARKNTNHEVRRHRIKSRIGEAIAIGYLAVDILPYLINVFGGGHIH